MAIKKKNVFSSIKSQSDLADIGKRTAISANLIFFGVSHTPRVGAEDRLYSSTTRMNGLTPTNSDGSFITPLTANPYRPWHGSALRARTLWQMYALIVNNVPGIKQAAFLSLNSLTNILAHIERRRAENSPHEQLYVICIQSDVSMLASVLNACLRMQPAEARQHLKNQLDALPSENQLFEKAAERLRRQQSSSGSAQRPAPSPELLQQTMLANAHQRSTQNVGNRPAVSSASQPSRLPAGQLDLRTTSQGQTQAPYSAALPGASIPTTAPQPSSQISLPLFESVKRASRKPVALGPVNLNAAEQHTYREFAIKLVQAVKSLLRYIAPLEASTKFTEQQKTQVYRRVLFLQDYASAVVSQLRQQPPVYVLSPNQLGSLIQQVQSLSNNLANHVASNSAARPDQTLANPSAVASSAAQQSFHVPASSIPTQAAASSRGANSPGSSVVNPAVYPGQPQAGNRSALSSTNKLPASTATRGNAPTGALNLQNRDVFSILESVYEGEQQARPPTMGKSPLYFPASAHRLGMRKLAYMSLQDMEVDAAVSGAHQKRTVAIFEAILSKCASELSQNAQSSTAKPAGQSTVVPLSEVVSKSDQSSIWNEALGLQETKTLPFPSLLEAPIASREAFDALVAQCYGD